MLGCVYLILAALLGREITHNFLPEQRMREKGITPLWVTLKRRTPSLEQI